MSDAPRARPDEPAASAPAHASVPQVSAATTLPPPPPPPPPHPTAPLPTAADRDERARVGELTQGWRWAVRACWIGAVIGYSSVWKASRDIGLPTWWLGQYGDPEPFFVSLLPYLAPVLMIVLSFGHSRALPWLGLGASAVGAVIGALDLSPYPGLGVVELVIAGATAAVSLASLAGRYRPAAR